MEAPLRLANYIQIRTTTKYSNLSINSVKGETKKDR